MALGDELRRRAATAPEMGWRPELFRLGEPAEEAALQRLLPSIGLVVDRVQEQLEELAKDRHPRARLTPAELARAVDALRDGHPVAALGAWCHYPWSGRLVHVLPAQLHRELLASRNRFKITNDEQARLARARVGVIGLSVGRAVALTLAMEGVGELRLADFDELSLSNLNRLSAGLHELGVNKAVSAARAVVELDPWRVVRVYEEGITEANLDAFLVEGERLDVVIEECDTLPMKFLVRERARAFGLPVLMETSDRGLLDVERFDLDPDRPSFHGLVGTTTAAEVGALAEKDRVPLVARILGGERISARAAASMLEMGEQVRTWPQLASDVVLGGGTVATAVRALLRGELTRSGRYSVDVDGALAEPEDLGGDAWWDATLSADAAAHRVLPTMEPVPALDRAAIEKLVACAVLAPSAHNAQPWRFEWDGRRLACELDRSRCLPALDIDDGGSICGIAAAVENLALVAPRLGHRAEVRLGEGDCVAEVRFLPDPGAPLDPLADQIAHRVTGREVAEREPLPAEAAEALRREAWEAGGGLQLLTADAELDAIGALLGRTSRIAFLDRDMHREIFGGFRWTRQQVESTRDGLDVNTLGVSEGERAILRLVASWKVMAALGPIGGAGLEKPMRDAVDQAAAVAVVYAPGRDRAAWLTAGRALQRVWLRATQLGLHLYPASGLPYLVARLERAEPPHRGLLRRVSQLQPGYRALFPSDDERVEATLLRITLGKKPVARSLRRPVSEVLRFA